MLEKAKYVNHLNQTIEFGSGGIFITNAEYRNYEWKYDNNYDEITNFHKGISEDTFKIIVVADTEEEGNAIKNQIFEIFERDILAKTPGAFYVGEFRRRCYISASKKSKWYISNRYLENEATMISDNPDWMRELVRSYSVAEESEEADADLKTYPYSYGYRYAEQSEAQSITNQSVAESDFIWRVYGPVSNPLITIAENAYQVNVSLDHGERLEVDSKRKTIQMIGNNGSSENVFWLAAKQGYIFQKIPPGSQEISWNGKFAFDLILSEERSEPPWT